MATLWRPGVRTRIVGGREMAVSERWRFLDGEWVEASLEDRMRNVGFEVPPDEEEPPPPPPGGLPAPPAGYRSWYEVDFRNIGTQLPAGWVAQSSAGGNSGGTYRPQNVAVVPGTGLVHYAERASVGAPMYTGKVYARLGVPQFCHIRFSARIVNYKVGVWPSFWARPQAGGAMEGEKDYLEAFGGHIDGPEPRIFGGGYIVTPYPAVGNDTVDFDPALPPNRWEVSNVYETQQVPGSATMFVNGRNMGTITAAGMSTTAARNAYAAQFDNPNATWYLRTDFQLSYTSTSQAGYTNAGPLSPDQVGRFSQWIIEWVQIFVPGSGGTPTNPNPPVEPPPPVEPDPPSGGTITPITGISATITTIGDPDSGSGNPIDTASGFAVDRKNIAGSDIIWAHNDSGHASPTGTNDLPRVFAFDTQAPFTLLRNSVLTGTGVENMDFEDMGTCLIGGVHYIYIADIGEQGGTSRTYKIYRFPIPNVTVNQTLSTAPIAVETFTFSRPVSSVAPGSADMEAMAVDPRTGDVYLWQKLGGVATRPRYSSVWRAPAAQFTAGGGAVTFTEVIDDLMTLDATANPGGINKADISEFGDHIMMSNNEEIWIWNRSASQTVVQAMSCTPIYRHVGTGLSAEAASFSRGRSQSRIYLMGESQTAPLRYITLNY